MSKEAALKRLAMDLTLLETLVREFQESQGLKVDGWPGKDTTTRIRSLVYGALPELATPIPRSRAGVHRTYGSFEWTPSRGRLVDIDDDWEDKNIRRFRLHTGQRRRLHRLVGDEFVVLFRRACDASGYTPTSVQTYNPRKIKDKPDSNLSMHSWGIAVDFDPRENPWGGVRKDGSPSLLRQNPEFIKVFEDAGWCWGGRWKGGKGDDMHFERRSPR